MKMVNRFRMLMVAAFAVTVVGIAGCSQPGQPSSAAQKPEAGKPAVAEQKPVEIDFWHIQATIYGDAVKEIVADFNKEYAGQIVVKETYQGKYDDLNKKLRAALQGGGLPTVAMAYESDTLEYMKANVIIPLDSYIKDPKLGLSADDLKDIAPGVLDRQRIPDYQGKTMSWPHGNSSLGLYYNSTLLKQAGFEKPAATWKEFEKQALDIYAKTGVPALVLPTASKGASYYSWLQTYGIVPIAQDASSVNYDNPESLELLTILKNLIDKKAIGLAENTEQEFTNGRAAMELGTTARTTSKQELILGKFQWGVTLIPQGKSGKKLTTLYGGNHVLFKTDAKKEQAGWIFMKYFASAKAQSLFAAKTGYFPATMSSQNQALLKKDYADNPQKAQAFTEVFPYSFIPVATAAKRVVDDAVGKAIEMSLTGNTDPAKALKTAQSDAAKALADFK